MEVVTSEFIKDKKVILRLDIDVPIENRQVIEDFRLRAGLPTLKLCLEYAEQVIVIGHIGRPEGRVVEELSVVPVREWLSKQNLRSHIGSGKLKLLENLRFDPREFDPREEVGDISFAKELASMGDIFVNEAFAAYRPAVSTTVLPKFLPHYAGLRFAEEVKVLKEVRENPKKPFVVVMGGAKVADKAPVIQALAKQADTVLVGGKIASGPTIFDTIVTNNVVLGKLNEAGTDITSETVDAWGDLLNRAATIIWNGPVGKFEDPKNDQSARLAKLILASSAKIIVGGGDTVSLLGSIGLLGEYEKKAFVSVGGGAMLKFLVNGTLPTIEVLRG